MKRFAFQFTFGAGSARWVGGLALIAMSFVFPAHRASAAEPPGAAKPAASAPAAPRTGINAYPFGKVEVRVAPPRGWKELAEVGGNTRVSFFAPDGRTVITLRMNPDNFPAGTLRNEKGRLLAKRRYPTAQVLMEAEWLTPEIKGRVIDFERGQKNSATAAPVYTRTRMATTSAGGGLLEVSFTAPAADFSSQLGACEALMASLKIQVPEEPARQSQLTSVNR